MYVENLKYKDYSKNSLISLDINNWTMAPLVLQLTKTVNYYIKSATIEEQEWKKYY